MGYVRKAVDAAVDFIGPYLEKKPHQEETASNHQHGLQRDWLVKQALSHLQEINTAEQARNPDALYDGSMVGVVYGLLDLITSHGILPFLSSGLAFGQRPQSVLLPLVVSSASSNYLLFEVLNTLIPISEQNGTGVQPLIIQRALPDLISGIAELAFSPHISEEYHITARPQFDKILAITATSRLLPILTTFLQQPVPSWIQPRLATELALIPLRTRGVRHTIEFLSLAYLTKNSRVHEEQYDSSQIPIPLEAIMQASRLLSSVPSTMSPTEWFTELAPQLWDLLDGKEGKELSRAAGQIIASGILNRKSTGAPGAIGWELFAKPLIRTTNPENVARGVPRQSTSDHVFVQEQDLKLALKRLSVIAHSSSHPGPIKRLLGPILLPLWGLIWYVKTRPTLDAEWKELPGSLILRYMNISCNSKHIDILATRLFWDGSSAWTFGPGSQGGVEIRQRRANGDNIVGMTGLLSQIGSLDERVNYLVALLAEASIDDETIGAIFLSTMSRWLALGSSAQSKPSLADEDIDPLAALMDAKLSEAMAAKFRENFARSPQHIMELMEQLVHNFVDEHKNRSEDLVSFALSILSTLVASPNFEPKISWPTPLASIVPSLEYLAQPHQILPPSPLIVNASANLLQFLQPKSAESQLEDPQMQYRATLESAISDLISPDPPDRTWAISTLRKLVQDSSAFPLIDIPSTTHLLLNESIADQESYVHTAAIPLLVDLAIRAPNPTLSILVDAFIDINERSLRLKKEQEIEQALDFRLRVGEILNNIVMDDNFWHQGSNPAIRFNSIKTLTEATISLASRRGQRHQTFSRRRDIAKAEMKEQEEGERAWGGPIPNLLDPEGENPTEQRERNSLLKIVHGWEDTGIEEDARIRASALSILGSIIEKRLELLSQISIDASLQMVIMISTMETGLEKGILRRAAVLVPMGLLRGLDAMLENSKESTAGLGLKQSEELEQVLRWVRDEDCDDLVKSHAESVLDGLETWRMKKLFKVRDDGFQLGANLGLERNLRGLDVSASMEENRGGAPIIEEID
ncbi:hypothetical protein CC78DRAFT_512815 [Lojkania enalia]|uniref:Uncharacterized protein n=1 Tax=Lojkania enalia TaxID=147567 RepID=A0A9P4KEG2_9PLEO|nr:hypothetical protein CC78DRAFT_512815 [Didymosphaeria enalia]